MTWEVESSLYEGYGASICDLTRPRGKQTVAQVREYRDAVLIVQAVEALCAATARPAERPDPPRETSKSNGKPEGGK